MFNREQFRLIDGATLTPKPVPIGVTCNYEALRVLALALLGEIEDSTRDPLSFGNLNFAEEVKRFESNLIRSALIQTGGRQRAAARLLGIKKSTLNAKIKRYKIESVEATDSQTVPGKRVRRMKGRAT